MSNYRFYTTAGLFTGLLVCFAVLLWDLQVVNGGAYLERSQQAIAQTETVPAARGKLLDRNGKILAQDKVTWTIRVSGDCCWRQKFPVRTWKPSAGRRVWNGLGPGISRTPPRPY